jgi:hypothetical protein
MRALSGKQIQQILDCEQVYQARMAVWHELDTHYKGSMNWKTVNGTRYLYRKIAGSEKSLGPESTETLQSYTRFEAGKSAAKARSDSLKAELRAMAPVNRALGIGRMPKMAARILRRLDRKLLLGSLFRVAGTHALYAYERMGGVHFKSSTLATMDIDLLYDARRALKLISSDIREGGLIGILQREDDSFAPLHSNSFRAVNDKGYMVDLITPSVKNPAARQFRDRIGDNPGDLMAAEIDGLTWLESSPSVDRIVIDERGFPVRMVVPDPRYFAAHKAWLAQRDDRPAEKRQRDRGQAVAVATMVTRALPDFRFDDPALNALPAAVRELGLALVRDVKLIDEEDADVEI